MYKCTCTYVLTKNVGYISLYMYILVCTFCTYMYMYMYDVGYIHLYHCTYNVQNVLYKVLAKIISFYEIDGWYSNRNIY